MIRRKLFLCAYYTYVYVVELIREPLHSQQLCALMCAPGTRGLHVSGNKSKFLFGKNAVNDQNYKSIINNFRGIKMYIIKLKPVLLARIMTVHFNIR